MPQRKGSARITLTLSERNLERIDELSRGCKINRSALIEKLVEKYIAVHDRKMAERERRRQAVSDD